MDEPRIRSLGKALTWRFLASTITAVIVLVITEESRMAIGAGLLDGVVKIGAYYLHERAWLVIPLTRRGPEEPESA